MGLPDSGQAGVHQGDETILFSADKALERVDRFRDDFHDLRECWNNRLTSKDSISEAYLNGRLEIALCGHWHSGSEDRNWFASISPHTAIDVGIVTDAGVDIANRGDSHSGQDEIVLVVVVEAVEGPERFVRSILRPYLFEDEPLSAGKGLLYRIQNGGGFKVLPKWVDRKSLPNSCRDNTGDKVVQGGPQVVNCISDDERERFGNWFRRSIHEGVWNTVPDKLYVRLYADRVEIPREWFCGADKFVDVAVGPFNL
jgi:hypothetical protein